jgi:hypothetical protein
MLAQKSKTATPSSNTGSKCQNSGEQKGIEIGIDWLQFVCPIADIEVVKKIIDFVSDDFDDVPCLNPGIPVVHGKRYENSGYSARGAAYAWNLPENENEQGQLWVSLPGSVLSNRNLRHIWRAIRGLKSAYSAKATRLDIKIDDFDKSIPKELILAAVEVGNYARFDYFDPREPRVKGVSKGWCYYFGSPQSDKRLRYYDKSAESGGEIDSYRMELQLRGRHSDYVFSQFASIWSDSFSEIATQYLGGVVLGAVDFIDRQSGDRLSRCKRLEWWQEFVDKISTPIRISLTRPKPALERTLQWIDKQVQTSLSMIRDIMGIDVFRIWLARQIDSGRERYSKKHEALIKVSKGDMQKGIFPLG